VAGYDKAAKVADKLLGIYVGHELRKTDHIVQDEHDKNFVQELHPSF